MRTQIYLPLLTVCILLMGCAGTSRVVTDAVAIGAGGLAGHKLSKGDPLITAAGAGAGLLVGETLHYANDMNAKKAYTSGFDKGRSDAVKQQYWVMVNQQKAMEGDLFDENFSLFDIPLPEHTSDGVLLNPTMKTLRIDE